MRIPSGLRGLTGNQAGPERGVEISLFSGGSVTVHGEPNSLEYKTPAEGIRDSLSTHCRSIKPILSAARIGKVQWAKGSLECGERVIVMMLAFRPGGSPNYGSRLETTKATLPPTRLRWKQSRMDSRSSRGDEWQVTFVKSP